MPLLKLYQIATPTSATQVTTTKNTLVRQVAISNSGANATAAGDSTLGAAATGVQIAANTVLVLGGNTMNASFDLSELYVIASTGNVNILAILL